MPRLFPLTLLLMLPALAVRESIDHLVRMSAGHDVNHMRQIERILARA